eukprot:scaffold210435_cov50-Prasinocladus_malaysianus.AAC.1
MQVYSETVAAYKDQGLAFHKRATPNSVASPGGDDLVVFDFDDEESGRPDPKRHPQAALTAPTEGPVNISAVSPRAMVMLPKRTEAALHRIEQQGFAHRIQTGIRPVLIPGVVGSPVANRSHRVARTSRQEVRRDDGIATPEAVTMRAYRSGNPGPSDNTNYRPDCSQNGLLPNGIMATAQAKHYYASSTGTSGTTYCGMIDSSRRR